MKTTTKIILVNSLVGVLIIAGIAIFSLYRFYIDKKATAALGLERGILTFQILLREHGEPFRISNGRLLAGDYPLNGNFEIPDRVQEIFGVTATVFQGDERIATNVLQPDGSRAVGTRLVGPAYDAVFRHGKPYRGEADILGTPYLTAYDPIRDPAGKIIGALYVGVKKDDLVTPFRNLALEITLILAGFIALLAVLFIREARSARELGRTRESHDAFLKTLIDTIPIPVFYKDAEGRYLGCNREFEACFGLDRGKIVGKTVYDIAPRDQAEVYYQADRELFRTREVQVYETRQRHADGTVRDVVFYKAVFPGPDGEVGGLIGTFLDITERKRAEEQAARALADLQRSNRELEQFAYIASHDLQEPLRTVGSYVKLLERRYRDRLDRDADEFIAYAVDGVARMQQMINGLLAFSRVGAGQREPGICDLAAAFRKSLENLGEAIREKGAVVTSDPLPTVMADEAQMIMLFQNLIGNGIKFSGDSPPEIRITAAPVAESASAAARVRLPASGWLFTVRDNGRGIPPEEQDKVFNLFERGSGRKDHPGSGIGLALCRKIVEGHGGSIWVESEPGKGSTFLFLLPEAPLSEP